MKCRRSCRWRASGGTAAGLGPAPPRPRVSYRAYRAWEYALLAASLPLLGCIWSRRLPSTTSSSTALWRFLYGTDPAVVCLSYAARALWLLGLSGPGPPEKRRGAPAGPGAVALPEPGRCLALGVLPASGLPGKCRWCKSPAPRRSWRSLPSRDFSGGKAAVGTIFRDCALVEQGRQGEEEMARLRQGLAAYWTTRGGPRAVRRGLPSWLRRMGQLERPRGAAQAQGGVGSGGRKWRASVGGGAVSAHG